MQKRNVLFFMCDQFHADCMGFIRPMVKTPNLDRLASKSLYFDHAYCPVPICGPSRSCLIRGQYAHNTRIEANNIDSLQIDPARTLPYVLQRKGYRTGLVGKAHLPRTWIESFEYVRLTDLADATVHNPTRTHYFKYLVDKGLASYYEEGNARPGAPDPDDGSMPSCLDYEDSIERFTGNHAVEFLEQQRNDFRPFFLKVSFQRPHGPIRPSQRHFEMYNPDDVELPDSAIDWFERRFEGKPELIRNILGEQCDYPLATDDPKILRRVIASYYGLITAIDEEIGRVLDTLDQIGETENTMVMFTADHGDFAGEHGLFHKNLGIYESIHRIPLIIHHPEKPQAGRHQGIAELIDVYPTVCDWLGVSPPDDLDGVSLLPYFDDPQAGKDEALCLWSRAQPRRIAAIRSKRYRMVYYGSGRQGELYDHEKDPGEIFNLWDDPDYAAVRAEHIERLLHRTLEYSGICEAMDDRDLAEDARYAPTYVLHKTGADWNRIVEGLQTTPALEGPANK